MLVRGIGLQRIETIIFGLRGFILTLLALLTLFLGWQAAQLRLDAGFSKMLPTGHPYIDTFFQYKDDFGGGNRILVVLQAKQGDIFTPAFLKTLNDATQDVFFIPGVARHTVTSLWTPNTRFIAVSEEGLEAGNVIPADFQPTPQGIRKVLENTLKADLVGRLVSNDFRAAMIRAELSDFDPDTGQKLDYFKLSRLLEKNLRQKYNSDTVDVRIIGFAKLTGDIAQGAASVLLFFGIAFVLTCLMLWFYCRSWLLTLVTVGCSLASLIWQFGTLHLLGFGLDPLAILVPFLVFAIGVSHGVQQINMMGAEIAAGRGKDQAARATFSFLLRPGSVALLTCLAGFATLYVIPIGMIKELSVTASIGIALKIISNLVMLPLLLSYIAPGPAYGERVRHAMAVRARFWPYLARIAKPGPAFLLIFLCLAIGVAALYESRERQIGDVHAGAGELWPDARYNRDSEYISSHFNLGLNQLTVIAEGPDAACVQYDIMDYLDQFSWRMRNVKGVQSVVSLPVIAKQVNSMWQEGNPKWKALPRSPSALSQATSNVPSSSMLVNADCSIIPVQIYLEDNRAATVKHVIAAAEAFIDDPAHQREDLHLRIGTGNVTVTAASNEVVERAELPMLLYVYAVVIALVLLTYRDWRGALCCVLPLVMSTLIGNWFLTAAGIGLKISTLPVLAIAVGIGVDYGIYEYNRIQRYMRAGLSPYGAYLQALNDVGSATMFTGATLAIGVSTWIFSALKFQADMGLLLTFMFLVNMIGAVTLLPALVAALDYVWPARRNAAPGQSL